MTRDEVRWIAANIPELWCQFSCAACHSGAA
jgi:hypothetical protein